MCILFDSTYNIKLSKLIMNFFLLSLSDILFHEKVFYKNYKLKVNKAKNHVLLNCS